MDFPIGTAFYDELKTYLRGRPECRDSGNALVAQNLHLDLGVIKSASQAAQAASSCCTLLQYCSQPWLARTTRSASILLRFSSFHQAPEIFSRFCMIERWALSISPEPMGRPAASALL